MGKMKGGSVTGIGWRMRTWRKRRNIKGYELAKMIKVSQGSLSDIENNKSDPSAHTLVKFLKLDDVDWFWIITGEEGKTPRKEPLAVINVSPGSEFVIRGIPS